MNCWSTKHRGADFVDGRLRERDRVRVAAHLAECEACALALEEMRAVRSTLRNLPEAKSPAKLRAALRVAASREKKDIADYRGSRFERLWHQWRVRFDEFMRPVTLPATGGIVSSLVLFAALAFTIGTTTRVVNYEVPVLYADRVYANLVPLQLRSAVILTLSLDGKGRITDYAVRDSSASYIGDPTRLQYNNISVPDFPSVLAMAYPVNRDISIEVTPISFRQ